MKKVLFINFPVFGHVNPQVNFCRELAKKDVKLVYYTFDQFFPKFKDIENIELKAYPKEFKDYYYTLVDNKTLHEKFVAILYVFHTLAEKILPFIMKEVGQEKPDLIICDTLGIWGKMAARYYKIPHVFFFSSLMGDSIATKEFPVLKSTIIKSIIFDFPYMLKIMSIKKKIEKQYGKVNEKIQDIMAPQGRFSMVMTSREFHPGGDQYPDNVKFIGPAHVDDSALPEKKDTIFISMGTIAFSDTFWDTCIEATKDLGYKIVISLGGNKNNKVSEKYLTENVEVYDYLNIEEYKEVLKKSVLFISHGGFNSISDSILYKTPLIICPEQAEQATNGKLIEQYGCGALYMPKVVEASGLRDKAIEVINSDNIKANLEKYRKSFLNADGYAKVIEALNKECNLY